MNAGPTSENRGYEDAMPVRLDRLHLFQIGKSPMPVKENTIPLNHVAARPPASNANRADKPTNGPRRRILVVGAVIGVLGLFFGIRYWMYASTHEDTDDLQPGTGSNFALLPPDNATGNFIKIVQRVPVKILFDPESIKAVRDKIVPGLSTVPSIAVTQPLMDKPYPEAPENEKPSHQPVNEPITQIRGVPATGVMQ